LFECGVDWGEFVRLGGGLVSDYVALIGNAHYPHPQCLRRADATLGSWFRRVRMRLSSSILRISAVISISTVFLRLSDKVCKALILIRSLSSSAVISRNNPCRS